MDTLRNLLGNGHERPPPPELADPDDVNKYYRDVLREHPAYADAYGDVGGDPTLPGKYDAKAQKQLADEANHKAEFPWLFDPRKGVRWDFDPIALRQLAQPNTWVGMLIQSITKEVAGTPWTIAENDQTRAEAEKRLDTHPEARDPVRKQADGATADLIAGLIADPNPDDDATDLIEMWLADLLEIGSMSATLAFPESAYGRVDLDTTGDEARQDVSDVLVDDDARPLHIMPTAPEVWTKDYRGKTGVLRGFWQFDRTATTGGSNTRGTRSATNPVFFDRAEVIWGDMSPRTNRRYGMPPTLLVEDFLQNIDLAITQEQNYLSKGSIPSGALIFEEWDRDELQEWKEENEENIKGKPHKLLMLAGKKGDVNFEQFSYNFKDLEFTERVQWYARVVASAFQVPSAVVGLEPEQINYHTFQGERENFEHNTLGPYMQKLERIINSQLIWKHFGDKWRFEFTPGVSESTRQVKSERLRAEFDKGLITRNEYRRQMGYQEADEDGYIDDVTESGGGGDGGGLDDILNADDDSDDENDDTRYGGDTDFSDARKDDALRNTESWELFALQPSDVEALAAEIEAPTADLFDAILSDDNIQAAIELLAADDVDKSLNDLTRRLRELITESEIVDTIAESIQAETTAHVREVVESAVRAEGATDDLIDPVVEQVQNRDVAFVDDFADRIADEIRDTVADGFAEGKNSREIRADIQQQAGEFTDWGAERIARQELQIATGEARSEFASEIDKVEVWQDSQDDRVRDTHEHMTGRWKLPGESWEVPYSEFDEGDDQIEDVPGDSVDGIGCRCNVLLRDRDEVDDDMHAGVAR